MSFQGWKFGEWFKGNWKTIKEIAKVLGPYLLSSAFFADPMIQVALTAFGKFLFDCGEYYVKEYRA